MTASPEPKLDLPLLRQRHSRLTPFQWTVYGVVSVLGHGLFTLALLWLFQGTGYESGSQGNTAIDVIELTLSPEELLAQVPEPADVVEPANGEFSQGESSQGESSQGELREAIASVPLEELAEPTDEAVEEEQNQRSEPSRETIASAEPSANSSVDSASPTIPLEPIQSPENASQEQQDSSQQDISEESSQRGLTNPLRNLPLRRPGFGDLFRDRQTRSEDDPDRGETNPASTSDASAPESPAPSSSEPSTPETSSDPSTPGQLSGDTTTQPPVPAAQSESANPTNQTPNANTDTRPGSESQTSSSAAETSNTDASSPSPSPPISSAPDASSSSPSGSDESPQPTSPGDRPSGNTSEQDSAAESTGQNSPFQGQIQPHGVGAVASTNPAESTPPTNSSPSGGSPSGSSQTGSSPSDSSPSSDSQSSNPQTGNGQSGSSTAGNQGGEESSAGRTVAGVDLQFSIEKTRRLYGTDFPDEDGYARLRSGNAVQAFLCPQTEFVPAQDLDKAVEVSLVIDRQGNLEVLSLNPLDPSLPPSNRYTNAILCELETRGFEPAIQGGQTVVGFLVLEVTIRGR